jgi:hypothetical protein
MASEMDATQLLQASINAFCKDQQNWNATLMFHVILPRETEARSCNIMSFVHGGSSYRQYFNDKIYFDTAKYRSPEDWDTLLRDLQRAALDGGTLLVANGSNKKTSSGRPRQLVCNHFRLYRTQNGDKENEDKNFKKTTLHNQRKNNRGKEGQSMARRTTTQLPTTDDARCTMRFNIMETPKGFYLTGGHGSACHANHYRLEKDQRTFPTRLIEKSEREIIESIGESLALNATGRNVHYNRCNQLLSRSQVLYINKLNDEVKAGMDLPSGEVSDMDSLINYFQKNGISFSLLDHTQKTGVGQLRVTNAEGLEEDLCVETICLDEEEHADMATFADDTRAALGTNDEQDLCIAIAWFLPEERRLFLLYPYVIHVDCISSAFSGGLPMPILRK